MLDPQEYLAPEYDIGKLTVANLRSILVEHEAAFPSNANKSQLINIFNEKVKSKKAEILKRYDVGASRNDIIDMTSGNDSRKRESLGSNEKIHLKEPSPVSEKDKIIPSKRHSDPTSPQKRNKRKTRKRVQSNSLSEDSSASPAASFLSMEKFEIDENDNIFRGPIDNTPITLLNKTKFSAKKSKVPVKDILSKFDKSVPSSKVFISGSTESKAKSVSPSPVKDSILSATKPVDTANQTVDNAYLTSTAVDTASILASNDYLPNRIENISAGIDQELNNGDVNDPQTSNTFDYKNDNDAAILINDIFSSNERSKQLNGPTKNIKAAEPVINIPSSDDDEAEVIEDKADEHLVSTLDVKSFSSLDTDDVSFSRESVDIEGKDEANEQESICHEMVLEGIDETETIEGKTDNENVKTELDTMVTRSTISKFSHVFKTLWKSFLLTSILAIAFFSFSLREIKNNTGYCGFEHHGKTLNLWNRLPDSLQNNLQPAKPYIELLESGMINVAHFECEECPENGTCDLNKLTCDYGYVKTYTWRSAFGLVPLQETCEYDYLREEKMRYLSKYTLSYLHRHNDKQLTLDELHDYLRSTKPSSMSVDEFEGYWRSFVEHELSQEPDLSINFNTKEITLSHRTPTEFYTRTFGNVQRGKKSKNLFKRTPPTVDLKNYYTKAKI
ncbi:hypothetical protein PICMEDRAFT_71642 [Pichia membranifaciens NRRL Y-2026]|uniref:LEM-like domain-containing protein n=1 Tax=Pichia membranifaciens NRRL Y-2026 TaxID=763406 RepID=A0A1E3NPF2_9ASCO|nr:hypothetical protein PICMEDRAFT_71642 [Pichia membranifaciens NRRL Y-2026]ODQ47588.1 hypothetical protein PICMEDRAFT_71642 [Pichia membranifaciens NRRL Y-2026]